MLTVSIVVSHIKQNGDTRKALNSGAVKYIDMHLSTMAQNVRYGFFGDLDVAIIEAAQINEDGSIVPTTSVGNSPTFVSQAKKVIVEVNVSQPLSLVGMHDIYEPLDPPHRKTNSHWKHLVIVLVLKQFLVIQVKLLQ